MPFGRIGRLVVVSLLGLGLTLGGLAIFQPTALGFMYPSATFQQQLKTQYFTAVCAGEPYWFSSAYNDRSVQWDFEAALKDFSQTLSERGASPKKAPQVMSYLLKVDPLDVLNVNAWTLFYDVQEHGLLDSAFNPTMSRAAADRRYRQLMHGYWETADLLVQDLRELCPGVRNGVTLGDGIPK